MHSDNGVGGSAFFDPTGCNSSSLKGDRAIPIPEEEAVHRAVNSRIDYHEIGAVHDQTESCFPGRLPLQSSLDSYMNSTPLNDVVKRYLYQYGHVQEDSNQN